MLGVMLLVRISQSLQTVQNLELLELFGADRRVSILCQGELFHLVRLKKFRCGEMF